MTRITTIEITEIDNNMLDAEIYGEIMKFLIEKQFNFDNVNIAKIQDFLTGE